MYSLVLDSQQTAEQLVKTTQYITTSLTLAVLSLFIKYVWFLNYWSERMQFEDISLGCVKYDELLKLFLFVTCMFSIICLTHINYNLLLVEVWIFPRN